MAMSVEEARTRFEALENRVLELQQGLATATQRVQTAEAEHQRLHAELERTRTLASAPRSDFKLIDPKSMIPEKFGTKAGPTWLDWSEGTRAYVEMLDVHLAKALKHVENHEAPLTAEEVDQADVAVQSAAQLKRYLKLRTEGNAKTIIKSAQASDTHVLEQWRRLSWEHDPIGLGTELLELHELTSPEKLRAKQTSGISAAIEIWEDLERRHRERQGVVLPEKVRISVLFKLIPALLADEILKQTTKWVSYTQLKEHLHSLQFLRTNGPAPMSCSNLEDEQARLPCAIPEEDTITTEDGEILRLEKRDGKRVAVKVHSQQPRGNRRNQGQGNECFRCGRKGHFARNCEWSTHVDGGPPPSAESPELIDQT